MSKTHRTAALMLLVLTIVTVAYTHWSSVAGNATAAAEPVVGATVTLKNFSFTPKTVRVKAGATVTWKSAEGSHTVASDNGAFNSPTLNAGQSFSFTFGTPGTYPYHCAFHGSSGGHDMAGTVIVTK